MAEHYTDHTTDTTIDDTIDDKTENTTVTTMSDTPPPKPPRGGGSGRRKPGRRGKGGGGGSAFLKNAILAKLVINKEEDGDGEDDGLFTIVRHRDILFCFSDKAAKRRLFVAGWRTDPRVHKTGIYIVTRKGVYKTNARAVAELLRQLPANFIDVHQGIAANILRVKWLEFASCGNSSLGFGVKRSQPKQIEEWLMLSRQCARDIKNLLEGNYDEEKDDEEKDDEEDD